jgi:uncharacterized protein YndB with AHSA1/START domain
MGGDILAKIEKSVEIKISPEKVWEMLALDRQAEWMVEWKSAQYTSEVRTPEGKYRVGASAHVTEKHGEFDLEITESLENEKITARSKGKYKYPWMGGQRVTMTVTYTLKPIEEGTRLTCAMDYEMSLERFGKGYLEKSIEKSLNNLKSILEK